MTDPIFPKFILLFLTVYQNNVLVLYISSPAPIFTNLSQERSLYFSAKLVNLNVTQALIGLTLSQTTDPRLFQTERVCRQQF